MTGALEKIPAQFLQFQDVPAELRHNKGCSGIDFPDQFEKLRTQGIRGVLIRIDHRAGQNGIAEIIPQFFQGARTFCKEALTALAGIFPRQRFAGNTTEILESFPGGKPCHFKELLLCAIPSTEVDQVSVPICFADGRGEENGIGGGKIFCSKRQRCRRFSAEDKIFEIGISAIDFIGGAFPFRQRNFRQDLEITRFQTGTENVSFISVEIHLKLYTVSAHSILVLIMAERYSTDIVFSSQKQKNQIKKALPFPTVLQTQLSDLVTFSAAQTEHPH